MGPDVTRAVIKIGGAFLAQPEALEALFDQLRSLPSSVQVLLVHGGGPQASDLSRALGVEPRKVAGRRVTDADTLEIVKMAYAGTLQTDLVAAARKAGIPAVGLTGVDARLVEAVRRPPLDIEGRAVDFGWVGDIRDVRTEVLHALTEAGFMPVVSPLAGSDRGEVFNINADTLAAALAAAWPASHLVFLLDTGGVLREVSRPESRLPVLTESDYARGLEEGWIHTGMRPKLMAGFQALKAGVPEVVLAAPADLAGVLQGGEGGTRLQKS